MASRRSPFSGWREALSDNGWLIAVASVVFSWIVFFVFFNVAAPAVKIDTQPVTEEKPKQLAPASPGGYVRKEICTQATLIVWQFDPQVGGNRYKITGPQVAGWVDAPPAQLDRDPPLFNSKILVEDTEYELTADVARCIKDRAIPAPR